MHFRFDADLSAAKEESTVEVQAKDKLAKEMDMLRTEHSELKDKFKVRMFSGCTLVDNNVSVYSV